MYDPLPYKFKKASESATVAKANSEDGVQKLRRAFGQALSDVPSAKYNDLTSSSVEVRAALAELNWPRNKILNVLKTDPTLLHHTTRDGHVWFAIKNQPGSSSTATATSASSPSRRGSPCAGPSTGKIYEQPLEASSFPVKPSHLSVNLKGKVATDAFGIISIKDKREADERRRQEQRSANKLRLQNLKGKGRAQDDDTLFSDSEPAEAQENGAFAMDVAGTGRPEDGLVVEAQDFTPSDMAATANTRREEGDESNSDTSARRGGRSYAARKSGLKRAPSWNSEEGSSAIIGQDKAYQIDVPAETSLQDPASPSSGFAIGLSRVARKTTAKMGTDWNLEGQYLAHEQEEPVEAVSPGDHGYQQPVGIGSGRFSHSEEPAISRAARKSGTTLRHRGFSESDYDEQGNRIPSWKELGLSSSSSDEAAHEEGKKQALFLPDVSPVEIRHQEPALKQTSKSTISQQKAPKAPTNANENLSDARAELDHSFGAGPVNGNDGLRMTSDSTLEGRQDLPEDQRKYPRASPSGSTPNASEAETEGEEPLVDKPTSIGKKSRRTTERNIGGSLSIPTARITAARKSGRSREILLPKTEPLETSMDLDDPSLEVLEVSDEEDADLAAMLLQESELNKTKAAHRKQEKEKILPVLDGFTAARSSGGKLVNAIVLDSGEETSTRETSANMDSTLDGEQDSEELKPTKPTKALSNLQRGPPLPRTGDDVTVIEDDDDDVVFVSSVRVGAVPGRSAKTKEERESERKHKDVRRAVREKDKEARNKKKKSSRSLPTFRKTLDEEYAELEDAYQRRRESRVANGLDAYETAEKQSWQSFASWEPPRGRAGGADMNTVAFWPYNLPFPGRRKHEAIVAIAGGTSVRVLRLSETRGISELWNANDESANWEREVDRENFYAMKWTHEIRQESSISPYWRKWPLLIVAGTGREAKILDGYTGTTVKVLQGHGGPINSIAVHPRLPHIIATASHDESVWLWDISVPVACPDTFGKTNNIYEADKRRKGFTSGERLAIFGGYAGHQEAILSIAIHPTLPLLMSGGVDCKLRIWRLPEHLPTTASSSLLRPLLIAPPRKSVKTPIYSFPIWTHHSLHSHHIDHVGWLGQDGTILTMSFCFESPARRVVRIFRPKFFDNFETAELPDVIGAGLEFDSEVNLVNRFVVAQASENTGDSLVDVANELYFDDENGNLRTRRRLYFPSTEPAVHCFPLSLESSIQDFESLKLTYPIVVGEEILLESDKTKDSQLRALACQPAGRGWMVAVGEMEKFNAWIKKDPIDEERLARYIQASLDDNRGAEKESDHRSDVVDNGTNTSNEDVVIGSGFTGEKASVSPTNSPWPNVIRSPDAPRGNDVPHVEAEPQAAIQMSGPDTQVSLADPTEFVAAGNDIEECEKGTEANQEGSDVAPAIPASLIGQSEDHVSGKEAINTQNQEHTDEEQNTVIPADEVATVSPSVMDLDTAAVYTQDRSPSVEYMMY